MNHKIGNRKVGGTIPHSQEKTVHPDIIPTGGKLNCFETIHGQQIRPNSKNWCCCLDIKNRAGLYSVLPANIRSGRAPSSVATKMDANNTAHRFDIIASGEMAFGDPTALLFFFFLDHFHDGLPRKASLNSALSSGAGQNKFVFQKRGSAIDCAVRFEQRVNGQHMLSQVCATKMRPDPSRARRPSQLKLIHPHR